MIKPTTVNRNDGGSMNVDTLRPLPTLGVTADCRVPWALRACVNAISFAYHIREHAADFVTPGLSLGVVDRPVLQRMGRHCSKTRQVLLDTTFQTTPL